MKKKHIKKLADQYNHFIENICTEIFNEIVLPSLNQYNHKIYYGMGVVGFQNKEGEEITDTELYLKVASLAHSTYEETIGGSSEYNFFWLVSDARINKEVLL